MVRNNNAQINRELKQLELDKRKNENELRCEQERIAMLLRNGLGKDIDNVLSGKTKVRMSLMKKIKYKIKFYIDKIFNFF